jgi:hypothetical protein
VADPLSPRLTDAELWRSVEHTLREIVLPALPEGEAWARAAVVQLHGLVRYAALRPADAGQARSAELADALESIRTNELLEWDGSTVPEVVAAAAGRALATAVGRSDAAAEEVRRTLRPIVVRHLDDELASTAPLVAAFRGVLDA